MENIKWYYLAITILAGFCGISSLNGCSRSMGSVIARIKNPEGMVETRDSAGEGFTVAPDNQPLKEGGAVRTGKKSSTRILFTDGSEVLVKSEAFFELGQKESSANQNQGMVIYHFKGRNKEIKIKTPHGATAVLGTKFLLDVASDSTTLVLETGKVSFTSLSGSESVVLTAGQRLIARTGNPLGKPQPVDPFERKSLFEGIFDDAKINRQ